jgi:hypothetical protein
MDTMNVTGLICSQLIFKVLTVSTVRPIQMSQFDTFDPKDQVHVTFVGVYYVDTC